MCTHDSTPIDQGGMEVGEDVDQGGMEVEEDVDQGGMEVGEDVDIGGDINGDIEFSGTDGGESVNDAGSGLDGSSYDEAPVCGDDALAEDYSSSDIDPTDLGGDTGSGEQGSEADTQSDGDNAAPELNSPDGSAPDSSQKEEVDCMNDAIETAVKAGAGAAVIGFAGTALTGSPAAVGVGFVSGVVTLGVTLESGVTNCGNSR